MSTFDSQFDRTRPYAAAYAGEPDDPTWRSPAVAAAALAGTAAAGVAVVGVAVIGAAAATASDAEATPDAAPAWGEGWDAGWGDGWGGGWDAGHAGRDAPAPDGSGDAGGAWLERGDYTDAGVGGDGESFYFIDGDSSLML